MTSEEMQQIITAIKAKSDEYDEQQDELINKSDIQGAMDLATKKTGLWEALLIIQKLN